jgi:hypothetical protein
MGLFQFFLDLLGELTAIDSQSISSLNQLYSAYSETLGIVFLGILSGGLIFFNLRRVKKWKMFQQLDLWEDIIWIGLFSVFNFVFGTIIFIFAEIFTIVFFPEFGEIIKINMALLINSSFFVLPSYLYLQDVSRNPKTSLQIKEGIILLLLGIFILIMFNMLEFWKTDVLNLKLIILFILIFSVNYLLIAFGLRKIKEQLDQIN